MTNIRFENIRSGEIREIDRAHYGDKVGAILSAMVNSSDIGENAKVEDFGWRLDPEQRAQVEAYEEDPAKRAEVSKRTGVPLDSLTIRNFVDQLSYELALASSTAVKSRRSREIEDAETAYKNRVKAAGQQAAEDVVDDVEFRQEYTLDEEPEAPAPQKEKSTVVNKPTVKPARKKTK